jgi:3-dehydroquinate synthase
MPDAAITVDPGYNRQVAEAGSRHDELTGFPTMQPREEADIRVAVELGPRSYEIRVVSGRTAEFGRFVRDALDATWAGRSCRSALIVTDEHLADLRILDGYRDALAGVGIDPAVEALPPGEATKSLGNASRLFDKLVSMNADRHTVVIAVGGGVIGDLAGFVAATYARGIPLVMIPTTLLAQVDSSVGGKVGVNHPGAKNIIGAFHQPSAVWIDTDTLHTLPDRELRCGLAEVVKYGVILDEPFFRDLEDRGDAILARDHAMLRRIVARSCELKASVVSRDEREETGLRTVLNFGHTIAHAIESVAGYDGPYQHGEAVAVGMVAEARLAERLGRVGPDVVGRIEGLLHHLGLPTSAPGLDAGRLLAAMRRDKKNRAGRIRFVLPRSIGRVELTDDAGEAEVRAVLDSL